ncbi:MAG: hypothetical protein NC221_03810 [Duncaniella sp.]|nr:hypothetical protein [Duncaniella sp.]
MKNFKQITILASLLLMAGCKSTNMAVEAVDTEAPTKVVASVIGGSHPGAAIPKVKIYKTNGDYDDLVPITLDTSRAKVVSFPAPTDLSEESIPVKLNDGFLLDRRGVGMNTAFTHYTYKEYMALPEAPTPSELLAAVISNARITEIIEMPFTYAHGDDIVNLCNEEIKKIPTHTPN